MEPREDTSLGESPETEEGLQKPKKARSEAQLKAFEKAREKRLESISKNGQSDKILKNYVICSTDADRSDMRGKL